MRNYVLWIDAISFLFVALVATFVGYGNVTNYSWEGAQVLVFVSLALAALCLFVERVVGVWERIRVRAGSGHCGTEP